MKFNEIQMSSLKFIEIQMNFQIFKGIQINNYLISRQYGAALQELR